MIRKVSQWTEQRYSAPLLIVLLLGMLGFFWMFNFSSLPISNPELVKRSGGQGLLDATLFYSGEKAIAAMDHYGDAGRKLYKRFLVADSVFIIVYSLGIALLITRLTQAVNRKKTPWRLLSVLPYSIGFLDCVENICIFVLLSNYPNSSIILGTISGIATFCKWLLTLVVLLFLVYGGCQLLMRRLGFGYRTKEDRL